MDHHVKQINYIILWWSKDEDSIETCLLGSLPVLSAHSFASNWQLLFLNQRKRENGRRNDFNDQVSTKECARRGDRTRGRLHARRTRFRSSYRARCTLRRFIVQRPFTAVVHVSVRTYVRTLRRFVAPAIVRPYIRTHANMTHCTQLFLCTCPSACQSVQSQTHRKVMHDRVESAS